MRIQTYIVESTPRKNFFQMSKVIRLFLGMGWKIIQVSLYNMSFVVKSVVHSPLKSCSSILQSKWEFSIRKCAPRTDECCLTLVLWVDISLIVARKSIHEEKYFTSSTIDNILVDKGSRIFVFWTSNIDILIIDAHSDGSLFFHNMNNFGNPLNY